VEKKMKLIRIGLFALVAIMSQVAAADVLDVKLHYVGPTEGSVCLDYSKALMKLIYRVSF